VENPAAAYQTEADSRRNEGNQHGSRENYKDNE
jgi:hypothetical protein